MFPRTRALVGLLLGAGLLLANAQAALAQSEGGQSEVGQSEVGQSEVGQSEVGQSEDGQSEVSQSEVSQSEVSQSEVGQSEVGQSEAPVSAEADGVTESDSAEIIYRLEAIRVVGLSMTAEHVVRRYVAVHEGEALNVDDERLEQTRYELLGTGFFSEVRLSLERGSTRGRVVLQIEVRERGTFQFDAVNLGLSEGLVGTDGTQVEPYVGLSVSDSNLLGTGDAFAGTLLLSGPQQGVRLRLEDPAAFGSPLAISGMAFFNHGREYFGDDDVLVTPLVCPGTPMTPCEATRSAVVNYYRGGGSLGTAVALSSEVRLAASYQLEMVHVVSRPDAASELRGLDVVPIDFHIQDGTSAVSMLEVNLVFDERDAPALTRSGTFVYVRVNLASRLLGSDYDFFRAEGLVRHWVPLPGWDHTLRFSGFAGAALGETPFYYRFYASDLSDLLPSRMLELNLDRRSPLNLFRNAIVEHRIGQLGARVDIEYQFQVMRAEGELRSFWLYANLGVYMLADLADFTRPIRGYSPSDLFPVDLTFDVGARIDTSIGVFNIGFSNVLGFISVGG